MEPKLDLDFRFSGIRTKSFDYHPWLDPASWTYRKNAATPDLEKIPCGNELAVFPMNSTVSVILPETGYTTVKKVEYQQLQMGRLHFMLFRHSEYGAKQFLSSDFNLYGLAITEGPFQREGICQRKADEVLPWVCGYVRRNKEKPHCLDPVDVEGHCSKICGKILN